MKELLPVEPVPMPNRRDPFSFMLGLWVGIVIGAAFVFACMICAS